MSNSLNIIKSVKIKKTENNTFEIKTVRISENKEFRVKQYGVLSELYYLIAREELLKNKSEIKTKGKSILINNNFEDKNKLLNEICNYYEKILLLRFIYFDYLNDEKFKEYKKILNNINSIFKIIDPTENKSINTYKEVSYKFLRKELEKIEINKTEVDEFIKLCDKYLKNKNDIELFIKISNMTCNFMIKNNINVDALELNFILMLNLSNQIIHKKTKDLHFKVIYNRFLIDCNESVLKLNDYIVKCQKLIINFLYINKDNINYYESKDLIEIMYKDINKVLNKLSNPISNLYRKDGRKCVAIGINNDKKYIAFSGSEEFEQKNIKPFLRLVDTDYEIAYLVDNVRCYYDETNYVLFNEIKNKCKNINNGDSDKGLLLNNSCSCCERKLLEKLNLNLHSEMYVKFNPCKVCRWAINNMSKCINVYYDDNPKDNYKVIACVKKYFNNNLI